MLPAAAAAALRGTQTARVKQYILMEQGVFEENTAVSQHFPFRQEKLGDKWQHALLHQLEGKENACLSFLTFLPCSVCGCYVALHSCRARGSHLPSVTPQPWGQAESFLHSKSYK